MSAELGLGPDGKPLKPEPARHAVDAGAGRCPSLINETLLEAG